MPYEKDSSCRWLWRWKKGPPAKEHKQPPEGGQGKETDSSLEIRERKAALDFSPVRPLWDF